MATYIVTSDRLAGFKRGDQLDSKKTLMATLST
jgi:hypothetical protein